MPAPPPVWRGSDSILTSIQFNEGHIGFRIDQLLPKAEEDFDKRPNVILIKYVDHFLLFPLTHFNTRPVRAQTMRFKTTASTPPGLG